MSWWYGTSDPTRAGLPNSSTLTRIGSSRKIARAKLAELRRGRQLGKVVVGGVQMKDIADFSLRPGLVDHVAGHVVRVNLSDVPLQLALDFGRFRGIEEVFDDEQTPLVKLLAPAFKDPLLSFLITCFQIPAVVLASVHQLVITTVMLTANYRILGRYSESIGIIIR